MIMWMYKDVQVSLFLIVRRMFVKFDSFTVALLHGSCASSFVVWFDRCGFLCFSFRIMNIWSRIL